MSGRRGLGDRHYGSFDAFELCARQGVLEGSVDVATLSRVADRLCLEEASGFGRTVAWRIAGRTDPAGRMALQIELDGDVPLECQRCLRPFSCPVAQRTLLLLARDEREQQQLDEDDEHEVLLAAAPIDARTLVEDELLLTLPFAPRCARPECAGAPAATERAPAMASAFAELAKLRGGSKQGK